MLISKMEKSLRPNVVGVRFSKVGKSYHFSAGDITDIKIGDMVVVETSRGWQLGQVTQVIENADPPLDGWKTIDRRASPRDLLLRQMWQMKEADVVSTCQTRSAELKLAGIKIASAEYSFDGSRLTILFSTETEEKYDLKSLRQDMQKQFAPSQVEMRQVGPRDVAKVLCGMGACGLETRCCCLFLTEFSSISIRMAKEQGISLTPSEITGMCGRLRCCLIYEYDTYVDARSKLPKRNKVVRTPQGRGKVIDIIPLRESVIVEIPEIGQKEFLGSEVFPDDEPSAVVSPRSETAPTQEEDQRKPGNESETSLSSWPKHTDAKITRTKNDSSNFSPSKSPQARRIERGGRKPDQKIQTGLEGKKQTGSGPTNQPSGGQRTGGRRWKKKPGELTGQSSGDLNRARNIPAGTGQQKPEKRNRNRQGPHRGTKDNEE